MERLHQNEHGYFAYFESKSSDRTYKTQYWTDDHKQFTKGMITCDCPAWIYKKHDEGRRCPHIEPMRELLVEAGIIGSGVALTKRKPVDTLDGQIKGLIDSL